MFGPRIGSPLLDEVRFSFEETLGVVNPMPTLAALAPLSPRITELLEVTIALHPMTVTFVNTLDALRYSSFVFGPTSGNEAFCHRP